MYFVDIVSYASFGEIFVSRLAVKALEYSSRPYPPLRNGVQASSTSDAAAAEDLRVDTASAAVANDRKVRLLDFAPSTFLHGYVDAVLPSFSETVDLSLAVKLTGHEKCRKRTRRFAN